MPRGSLSGVTDFLDLRPPRNLSRVQAHLCAVSRTSVLALGIQQALKSFYANVRWQQDSILKQAPFGMASVLDSVTPPSAELAGESIGVHDEFFGHVNVKSVLRFFPQRAGFPLCLFHLGPHFATSPESRHCNIALRSCGLLSGARFQPALDQVTLESTNEREHKSERR